MSIEKIYDRLHQLDELKTVDHYQTNGSSEEMSSKKVGRPPSDKPKSKTIEIRVDEETLSKLDVLLINKITMRVDEITFE